MARKTLNVLFFIKKARLLKNGEAPVCMRITVNGCMVDVLVKRSCPVNLWNQAKENSKGKDRMSVELNHYLEITRSRIHQIYRELESAGKTITVDLMRKLYYGVDEDSKTLLQVFREHNEQSRKLIGKDFVSKTVQRYETTTRYLEEFIKKEYQLSDIALNNLEANFISRFDAFLKIEKGCAQNSAITRLKNLKKIIRIALENDWIKKDPFAYYRFKLEETDPEFLTMDEIKIILAKEFTIKRVEQVRDVFVFCIFTGLAFSDVKDLSPEHLVKDNKGELWIRKNRQKTKIMCNIPVLPVAASILEKYKNVAECTGKLLPVLSNIPRFVDVIQNSSHRFITDEDRKKLENSITYTHPKTHPASMIVFDDGDTLQDKFNLSQQVSYEYTLEVTPTSLSFGPTEAVKGLSISSFRTKFVGGVSTGIKEQVPYTATVVSGAEAFFLEEVAVTARQNDTGTSRSGTIQVVQEGSEKIVTVSLTQEAGVVTWEHSFAVTPISMNFTYAAGTQNVSIMSSKQKKINGINTGSPISVGFTSVVTTGHGIFSVNGVAISTNRNDTEAIRGGAVTYTQNESGKTAGVSLSQAAGQVTWEYTLSVTPSSLSFGASGGTQTVNLTSYKRKYINSICIGEQVNVGCAGLISGLGYSLSGTAIIAEQNETFRTKSEIATFTQFESEKKVSVSISQSYTGLIPSEAPNGIYIVHTNGKMYSRSNWKVSENSNAVGIGVKTVNCSFIIAPDEKNNIEWGGFGTLIGDFPPYNPNGQEVVIRDYNGKVYTNTIIAALGDSGIYAANYCRNYTFKDGKRGYLPSMGELYEMYQNLTEIEDCLSLIGGHPLFEKSLGNYWKWSSLQGNERTAWNMCFGEWYAVGGALKNYTIPGKGARPFTTLL